MNLIIDGMMNQDLIVAHEHFMTPSAQLADYVLPGDSWLERPWLSDGFGWTANYRTSEQAMQSVGEAKSTFEFWKLLAAALDRPEIVPWDNLETFYDYRLQATGKSFKKLSSETDVYLTAPRFRKYEETGFATPSGKGGVEILRFEDLGFDGLPYFREDPPLDPNYPLQLFTGVREDGLLKPATAIFPKCVTAILSRWLLSAPARPSNSIWQRMNGSRSKTSWGAFPLWSRSATPCPTAWCACRMAGGNRKCSRASTYCPERANILTRNYAVMTPISSTANRAFRI